MRFGQIRREDMLDVPHLRPDDQTHVHPPAARTWSASRVASLNRISSVEIDLTANNGSFFSLEFGFWDLGFSLFDYLECRVTILAVVLRGQQHGAEQRDAFGVARFAKRAGNPFVLFVADDRSFHRHLSLVTYRSLLVARQPPLLQVPARPRQRVAVQLHVDGLQRRGDALHESFAQLYTVRIE